MMDGKRVLVTGGTTGIGRAIVRHLASQGARVLTFARERAPLDEIVELGRTLPGEVHGLTADIADRGEIDKVFAEVDARLGGLDIFVSNAALSAEPLDAMDEEAWRYVVEVNLVGAISCTRAALQRMPEGGHIVVIGSISADIRAPGESVYSATKGALQSFVGALRKEVKDRGVRVSLIEPGTVGTDMQGTSPEVQREEIGRAQILHADDIAEAVDYIVTRPERCDIVSLRIEPRLQDLP